MVCRATSRFGGGPSSPWGLINSIWACIPSEMTNISKLASGTGGVCGTPEVWVPEVCASAVAAPEDCGSAAGSSFCGVFDSSGSADVDSAGVSSPDDASLSRGSPSDENRRRSLTLTVGSSFSSLTASFYNAAPKPSLGSAGKRSVSALRPRLRPRMARSITEVTSHTEPRDWRVKVELTTGKRGNQIDSRSPGRPQL